MINFASIIYLLYKWQSNSEVIYTTYCKTDNFEN